MSDFESGAFNRALPPLRIVTYYISAIYDRSSLERFRRRTSGVRFGVPSIPAFTSRSTAEAWCSGARWEYRMTICSVLCPSSSATVRRSTPAITSLLAKVWRLQCQVYPSILASSSALGNQPRDPWRLASSDGREDWHRFDLLASTIQFPERGEGNKPAYFGI